MLLPKAFSTMESSAFSRESANDSELRGCKNGRKEIHVHSVLQQCFRRPNCMEELVGSTLDMT